jgi:hypothetical protein
MSGREALAIFVEIAVWQSYRLGPAVIRINRLVESDPDLKSLWSRRPGRRARLTGVVGALRRDGELREELSTRDAVALLNVLTMPEAIMSLRDAGSRSASLLGS